MSARSVTAALTAAGIASCLLFGSGPPLTAQSRRPLEPDDLFELRTLGDPRISPDGAWIAYTSSSVDRADGSSTDIYMVSTAGGAPVRLTSGKKQAESPRWSPDGRYLAFLSLGDKNVHQVFLLDRRGGDAQQLTSYLSGASAIA